MDTFYLEIIHIGGAKGLDRDDFIRKRVQDMVNLLCECYLPIIGESFANS
jgi:hypothetical protein